MNECVFKIRLTGRMNRGMLRWFRRVDRINSTRIVKQIYGSTTDDSRIVGKQKGVNEALKRTIFVV